MRKRHKNTLPPFSHRALRVGELLRQKLSSLCAKGALTALANTKEEAKLLALPLTITQVEMTEGLGLAEIYIMPLSGCQDSQKEALTFLLNKKEKHIRPLLVNNLNLKYAPAISFKLDRQFDKADKINQLLDKIAAS